jgi:hypothetical protein
MDNLNFISENELSAVLRVVSDLNKIGVEHVSLENTKIYDCNGDIIGRLSFSPDALQYVFVPDQED